MQSLDAYLDTVSGQAVSIRAEMKQKEQRMKEINILLSHIANLEAHKPVHVEYAAIRFKKPREQFAAAHRDELDAVSYTHLDVYKRQTVRCVMMTAIFMTLSPVIFWLWDWARMIFVLCPRCV